MFLVVRTPCKTVGPKFVGHKRTTGEAGIATTRHQCISGIRLELQWKLRLPCPQAVWGAIRGGFIPKPLS